VAARAGGVPTVSLFPKEECVMPLDPKIKKSWEELQRKYPHPVNALGIKIADKDQMTLKVWKEEGIDKFVQK